MIDMSKQYRTRDGRAVRILCVDSKTHQPVIGLITISKCSGFDPMVAVQEGKRK